MARRKRKGGGGDAEQRSQRKEKADRELIKAAVKTIGLGFKVLLAWIGGK